MSHSYCQVQGDRVPEIEGNLVHIKTTSKLMANVPVHLMIKHNESKKALALKNFIALIESKCLV